MHYHSVFRGESNLRVHVFRWVLETPNTLASRESPGITAVCDLYKSMKQQYS